MSSGFEAPPGRGVGRFFSNRLILLPREELPSGMNGEGEEEEGGGGRGWLGGGRLGAEKGV